jgi:glycerol-3-phosphate dehydrogenase
LVATAYHHGAALLNYCEVTAVSRDGARFRDLETGEEHEAAARVVVNATGPFSDAVRRMADPAAEAIIAPSQGVHLVFDASFLPAGNAIMVPHTSDGRILFAIPWHGHTVVGTTDTPVESAPLEPAAFEREIDFILDTAALYLEKKPMRSDILSIFAGIRPLVRSGTARGSVLPRDHTVRIEDSGIVTVAGGKWTTYRRMSEDAVTRAAAAGELPERPCRTRQLPIRGAVASTEPSPRLHPALPYTEADVVHAARQQMARTVEDVLARRTRALFLNARAAIEMAPRVAQLLARELGRGADWQSAQEQSFVELSRNYLPRTPNPEPRTPIPDPV